ncbi:MAG: hypothetical protein COZ91_03385 [Candidatus Nealsonbacteria bacterium CG_4_8_14_3_um_filter_39_7]|uniref:Cell division protein FtsL n=1 Tax=Candidatus Nealsonbacteria bacterium CG23_combo_of_CG06-09_8_20_14_all_39_17 TaxID=1974722 RepID=A0A2G9YU71_9BACT|nr:MAG: hypothetical protein COX37_02280 [Candidatus Nealsonbacteria bacterium CG23_combo_of_CG06-09_8_20_14_all_39_17]PIU43973.1 MAG: hypothetical protein COS96_01480 [Candidatus Nealsonbacteria bacterium CG07_land_8_20_14_0_80_39_13]PIW90892.1 MAG: hypothetical protein COZ91_03385 [Candidatus Nealsonbacteria bacterium CG_4_8_14_3_um_filter_39_7]
MKSLTLSQSIINTGIKLELSVKFFWTIAFVLLLSLLTIYILQVNGLTEEIYLVKESKQKIHDLSSENESLAISLSKAGSLANVGGYLSGRNFEKANQVKYIQNSGNPVAINK